MKDSKWMMMNGTEATGLFGNFKANTGLITLEKVNESLVGSHKTIIRSCSALNELFELYLGLTVK
jgi:hypothetical protein